MKQKKFAKSSPYCLSPVLSEYEEDEVQLYLSFSMYKSSTVYKASHLWNSSALSQAMLKFFDWLTKNQANMAEQWKKQASINKH